jgi:hypothetical protein
MKNFNNQFPLAHTTLSLPKQTSSGTIQKRKATNPSQKHTSDSQIKKQTGEQIKKQIIDSNNTYLRGYQGSPTQWPKNDPEQ